MTTEVWTPDYVCFTRSWPGAVLKLVCSNVLGEKYNFAQEFTADHHPTINSVMPGPCPLCQEHARSRSAPNLHKTASPAHLGSRGRIRGKN
jgi:hypothetical protein